MVGSSSSSSSKVPMRAMNRSGAAKKAWTAGGGGEATSCDDVAPEEKEEEEITNVFTVELDTLECSICFMPFESRVYACKNGHVACANCCVSIQRKCSFCGEPIGYFRCRTTENILAGMTRPCKFSNNGCPATVKFTEIRSHEECCRYAPYCCPFAGCTFRGLHLYGHILKQHATGASTMDQLRHVEVTLHRDEPFRALLHQGEMDSVFLLLNGADILTGRSLLVRSLSLVRVCPHPALDDAEEKCTMLVVGDGKPGSMSLVGMGTVQFVRQLEGFEPKGCLFVPDAPCGDTVTVDVHFR